MLYDDGRLNCLTVKSGEKCSFMTKKGCGYNGGTCLPIIEKCVGCKNVKNEYCSIYPEPLAKWGVGGCGFATHIEKELVEAKKVNPLKASKKASKKKK